MKRVTLAVVLLALQAVAALAEELSYDVTFNDRLITEKANELSAGDRVILNDTLLQNGAKAGQISGVCTVTDPAGVMLCTVIFMLAEGTVSTQFANSPPPEKHFAVFGGTGAYAGRAGAGVLTEHGDGTGSLVLTIE